MIWRLSPWSISLVLSTLWTFLVFVIAQSSNVPPPLGTSPSPVWSANDFINADTDTIPRLPLHFRCKARAWMHTSREPLLLLYHYDGELRRTREDYYTLIDTFHKRFVSDFKDYGRGRKYWVFHKQPKSPRMCVIAPIMHSFVDQAVINTGRYIGEASVTLSMAKNESVHCQHWRFSYDGREVEACLQPPSKSPEIHGTRGSRSGSSSSSNRRANGEDSGARGHSSNGGVGGNAGRYYKPVLIQHPMVRLEVLHFEAFESGQTPPHWHHVFDAQRASKARCTAWD